MTKRFVWTTSACVIAIIVLSFCWLNFRTEKHPNPVDRPYSGTSSSFPVSQYSHPDPTTLRTRLVDPTYELTAMIEAFESKQMEDSRRVVAIAEATRRWQSARSRRETLWGSGKWMKPPEYYHNLDTKALTLVCFERPVFSMEMMVFKDPMFGLIRLKYMHNGFSELFSRSDMWQGILQLYEHLGDGLQPNSSLASIRTISLNLFSLQYLYQLPEFKAQVKGHETQFLKAHIRVLKQYRKYMDSFNPSVVGSQTPFFAEPIGVAEMALVLAKQIDPKKYSAIEKPIREIRFPEKQDLRDVRSFVNTVLYDLEDVQQE